MDRQFLECLSNLSAARLERVSEHIKQELCKRKKDTTKTDPTQFITYESQFLDETQKELLRGEVSQFSTGGRITNTWITLSDRSYGWGDTTLTPLDMSLFPCIKRTLEKLNSSVGSDQHPGLDSCLVTYYPSGQGVGYHSDFEKSLDDSAPIAVVTLGETRRVEFKTYGADLRGAADYSLLPVDGSMYTMKSGCQEVLKHRVPKGNKIKGSLGRFALSFRRVDSATTTDPVPPSPPSHQPAPPETEHRLPSLPPQEREVTVLIGTSMSKWIPSGPGFINLSTSGARLISPHPDWKGATALDMLRDLKNREPELSIGRLIVAFGTNDVRYKKGNFEAIGDALKRIVEDARSSFGIKRIFLAHLIPLRPDYRHTVANVVGYNDVVNRVAAELRCEILCWTCHFLDKSYNFNHRLFSRDGIHLNRKGYRVLSELVSWVNQIRVPFEFELERNV
jgi:alkylated DNA repair dioxygenase AlkB